MTASDDSVKVAQIAWFLDTYFGTLADDEWIELRFTRPRPGQKDEVRWKFGTDTTALAAHALAMTNDRWECYFGPAPRTRGIEKGDTEHLPRVRHLWLDLDFKDLDPGDQPMEKYAIQLIKTRTPALPQILVRSGHGIHAHWVLDAPVDAATARDLLRRLALHTDGDLNSAKPAQPMRLPGTVNRRRESPTPATWQLVPKVPKTTPPSAFDALPREPKALAATAAYAGTQTDHQQLREALRHIPPKPVGQGYDAWVDILQGIWDAFPGEDGLALAQDWDPRKAEEIGHKWKSFKPGAKKVGSVFWEAKQRGYERPRPTGKILTGPRPPIQIGGPPPDRKNGIRLSDFLKSPPPPIEWVLEGLLPRGGSSLCVSRAKVGKSFFMFNLAMAITARKPFLGRETTHGTVCYFSLDMPLTPLFWSLEKLAPTWGTVDDLIIHDKRSDPDLKARPLARTAELIMEHKPILTIVDTTQKATQVKDSNNYADVVDQLEDVTDLAESLNTHICLIHHANKGGADGLAKILGSVAYEGGVDTIMLLERDEQVGGLRLEIETRWSLPPHPMALGVDEHTRQVFLIDQNRERAARQACGYQIVAYLTSHPQHACTEREIRLVLPHEPATITRALNDLEGWARIAKEGTNWTLPVHARPRPSATQGQLPAAGD